MEREGEEVREREGKMRGMVKKGERGKREGSEERGG